jgi:hypothetical protein
MRVSHSVATRVGCRPQARLRGPGDTPGAGEELAGDSWEHRPELLSPKETLEPGFYMKSFLMLATNQMHKNKEGKSHQMLLRGQGSKSFLNPPTPLPQCH